MRGFDKANRIGRLIRAPAIASGIFLFSPGPLPHHWLPAVILTRWHPASVVAAQAPTAAALKNFRRLPGTSPQSRSRGKLSREQNADSARVLKHSVAQSLEHTTVRRHVGSPGERLTLLLVSTAEVRVRHRNHRTEEARLAADVERLFEIVAEADQSSFLQEPAVHEHSRGLAARGANAYGKRQVWITGDGRAG